MSKPVTGLRDRYSATEPIAPEGIADIRFCSLEHPRVSRALDAMSGVDFIEVAVCTNPVFYVVGLAGLNRERVIRDREPLLFSINRRVRT
jgi:hypothetical protein